MFEAKKSEYTGGDEWISVRELLLRALACAHRAAGRTNDEGEDVMNALRLIASMQVEPDSIYCEEGAELGDPDELEHWSDLLSTAGAWVYYGVEAENFFLVTHMETREAALAKVAELSAEPDSLCCLVEL